MVSLHITSTDIPDVSSQVVPRPETLIEETQVWADFHTKATLKWRWLFHKICFDQEKTYLYYQNFTKYEI
jgi:hypothetical protein